MSEDQPEPEEIITHGGSGKRVDREALDEAEHFHLCKICGQAVDRRDLGDVLYHEQPEHDPRPRS